MIRKFVRYAGVGAIGTGVHYVVLVGLVQRFATSAVAASTAGFVLGAFVNYGLNHQFTFESERSHRVALPRFLAVACAGLLLNALVISVIVAMLPLHYVIAQIVATGAVLAMGFLANSRWTF